jgi:hypothetical protein
MVSVAIIPLQPDMLQSLLQLPPRMPLLLMFLRRPPPQLQGQPQRALLILFPLQPNQRPKPHNLSARRLCLTILRPVLQVETPILI